MDNNIDVKKLLELVKRQSEDVKNAAETTNNQAIAVYEMYKDIEETKKEIKIFRQEMREFSEETKILKYKIDNFVFLTPAESNEMSDLVRQVAIKISDRLNYIRYYPDAKDFGDIVKRVMIGVRAMLRAKFKAQRWYMIKHVDYDNAMDYLNGLDSNDFLTYRSTRDQKNKKSKQKRKFFVVR